MNSQATKKSVRNVAVAFAGQIIIMAMGLILPRLLITGFGSEINGFFSTVTQIYAYLEVLRAGVGMAAIQALYKPICENDRSGISEIVSSSRAYFRKQGRIYLWCVALICLGFVLLGRVGLAWYEILIIVLAQGISGWISYSGINWFVDLLRAEGKNYVFLLVNNTARILTQVAEILLILITKNPVLVKLSALVLTVLQYYAFRWYRNRKYRGYDFGMKADVSLLKNRKSYLITHITGLICTSTDVVLLSIFCGYEISSVYSVYYMVAAGVNAIINTVYSGTSFLLGHSYQKGAEEFEKVHDTYHLIYTALTACLFSVCYVLILPFVRLYTRGVEDVNYIYTFLPLLFCVIQILSCGKNVEEITVNVGGYARKMVPRSITEAAINLGFSLILIPFLGIYGALLGTVVALSYRLVDLFFFTGKYVLKRSPRKQFLMLGFNLLLFGIAVVAERFLHLEFTSYLQFFGYGAIVFAAVSCFFVLAISLCYPQECRLLLQFLKHQKKDEKGIENE